MRALVIKNYKVAQYYRTALQWWQKGLTRHGAIWKIGTEVVLAAMIAGILIPVLGPLIAAQKYHLSADTIGLVGQTDQKLVSKLAYDGPSATYKFNADAVKSFDPTATTKQTTGSPSSKDSLYAVDVPENLSQGVSYTDINSQLSFSLVPKFKTDDGKNQRGHLVYPLDSGAQAIYTLKNNGLKEDIVIDSPRSNDLTFNYQLNLPKTLDARIIPGSGGAIGIYSANPSLFGDITYGSPKDQTAIENARVKGAKDYLVFGMPAPVIKATAHGSIGQATAKFTLDGNYLSVVATGLKSAKGAITVDPSVVVTSTTDFTTGYSPEGGNIDFSMLGQITRAGLTGGSIGTYTTTTANPLAIEHAGTTIYNGYIYSLGGFLRTPATGYATVSYAPLSPSDGSVGTWNSTTALPFYNSDFTAIPYNGYMYMVGGTSGQSGGAATVGTWFAPINTNGTLGTWIAGTDLPQVLKAYGAAAYNGFIYVLGGNRTGVAATYVSTVYYAALNADGSYGAWNTTTSLTYARSTITANVYNGYIYIFGGANTSTFVSDVQYAKIGSDGTLGSWMTTNSFSGARYGSITAMYNGYAYLEGGWSGGSNFKNDVQYAPINANGSLGTWVTTISFTGGRCYPIGGANNGYLYIGAGWDGTNNDSDVQFAKIDPNGSLQSYVNNANSFTTTRRGHQAMAYYGRLYVLGGDNGGTPTGTIYDATLNADGTVGTFSNSGLSAFNATGGPVRTFFNAFISDGYMYVLGGCITTFANCNSAGNTTTTVYSAALNRSTGAVNNWTAQTGFNTGRYGAGLAVYNGYVYVMGGVLDGGNLAQDVQYAAFNAGTIGTWTTTSSTYNLPTTNSSFGMAMDGSNVYMVGGCTAATGASCTTRSNAVYHASLSSTGGFATTWSSAGADASFANARYGLSATIVNGFLYLGGGYNLTNYYGDTQFAAIDAAGNVGAWQTGPSNAVTSTGLILTSANNTLYWLGGQNGSGYQNAVSYAVINNGGAGGTGTWTTNTTSMANVYPNGIAYTRAFASNGYLYVVAGRDYGGTGAHADVEYAAMNADGSVGTFAPTTSLNTARLQHSLVSYNGYVYAMNGQTYSGTKLQTVEYAAINTSGSLSAWNYTTNTNATPGPMTYTSAAAYNGYMYLMGGSNASGNLNTAQYAPINADGTLGVWTMTTSFNTARYGQESVAYNGYLYLYGGTDGAGTHFSDVQYAPISPANGSIGTWSYTTPLLAGRTFSNAEAYNGYLYIYGGYNNSSTVSGEVQYAPFNADGSIGRWQNAINSNFTTARSYGAGAISNGYMYLLGGYSDSVTYLNDIQYAPINTMPRTGTYSKLIDLGGVKNVSSITYNGKLSGGTRSIKYFGYNSSGVLQSSGTANNISALTLCTTSLSSIRYIRLMFALSDARTGGAVFPDTAGTSISNITDFTVNSLPGHPLPSQRLHLGKTLTTGVQIGLDTCGS